MAENVPEFLTHSQRFTDQDQYKKITTRHVGVKLTKNKGKEKNEERRQSKKKKRHITFIEGTIRLPVEFLVEKYGSQRMMEYCLANTNRNTCQSRRPNTAKTSFEMKMK